MTNSDYTPFPIIRCNIQIPPKKRHKLASMILNVSPMDSIGKIHFKTSHRGPKSFESPRFRQGEGYELEMSPGCEQLGPGQTCLIGCRWPFQGQVVAAQCPVGNTDRFQVTWNVPSGKHNYGNSPCLMDKSTINGHVQ